MNHKERKRLEKEVHDRKKRDRKHEREQRRLQKRVGKVKAEVESLAAKIVEQPEGPEAEVSIYQSLPKLTHGNTYCRT